MVKKEYKLNPKTLTYEVIRPPYRLRIYRALRKVLIGFILASVLNFLFSYFFYTPKMYYIDRDNRDMAMRYEVLQEKIAAAENKLGELKHRDQYVYRPLFGQDTLSLTGIYTEYPAAKYAALMGDMYSDVMIGTWKDVDQLARSLYLQSVSLDELQELSFDKERMAVAIPAIWPIDKTALRNNIGRFGMRNHPILGRYMMHTGIDLGANKGTPVYATASGTIESTKYVSGYGNQILVNHEYGYKTRYAHLSKVHVREGQTVRRGELIGEVGNTGRSTSSHLHYEVIYMGQHVDPVNYFRRDMSEEDFQKIIDEAKETTYE